MQDNSDEVSGSPDDDARVDARTVKVERFVVAAAIIGPILLAVWAWLQRGDHFDSYRLYYGTIAVVSYFEMIVMQGLMVWIAWRHPILGGRFVQAIVITLLVRSAFTSAYWWELWTPGDEESRAIAPYVLATQVGSLLLEIAALVLMRRLFHIVLVKRGEPRTYRPSRVSIRELMLWTLVIAAYMGFYLGAMRWAQANTNMGISTLPAWFTVYSVMASYVPPAFLVVVIVYCLRFSFWKWLPVVLATCLLASYVHTILFRAMLDAHTDIGVSINWGIGWREYLPHGMFVLMTVVAIWILRKLGYQFQIGSQVPDSSESPAMG